MSEKPKVSVVIPVYNAEKFLEESLGCLFAQTFQDFEIICVNDGSTDASLEVLKKQTDERIKIIDREHSNAGACRNAGLEAASGEFVYFYDADDRCMNKLLELSVRKAEETGADIVAFHFRRFYEDGSAVNAQGIHLDWINEGTEVFNYQECPSLIMSVVNPTPWNKIYRRDFLMKNHLRFEEISSWNDITFGGVSTAYAERISYVNECLFEYRVGHSGTITAKKAKSLTNVMRAVESAEEQVKKLPYFEEIKNSCRRFVLDNLMYAFENNIPDYSSDDGKNFYNYLSQKLQTGIFEDVDEFSFEKNPDLYRKYKIINSNTYDDFMKKENLEIIISLTSYPARIHCVPSVVDSLINQSKPASRIILWLAENQFPQGLNDLPDELVKQIDGGAVELRWCEDLLPHKKYYYAMKENPDAIIITVDDDITYDQNLVKNLFLSYMEYPYAVSAGRSHLMIIDENNELLPYEYWMRDIDGCLNQPSLQLFATGVGGVLYPPHILNTEELFNIEAIKKTCLRADDMWLKAIELLSDVPVVQACRHKSLKYIPGSQETALYKNNLDQNENDIYWNNICRYFSDKYGRDIISEKLVQPDVGVTLIGVRVLCDYIVKDHKMMKEEVNNVNRRLKKAYQEKSEINRRLQQTYAEKSEINRKLQITYKEKAERGIRIKELEKQLKSPRHFLDKLFK